ncbi:MAG: hypothetical protein IJT94_03765 [Oscillibacter sp.]|nr:hypothetical protein [Oscillibacter sp.]
MAVESKLMKVSYYNDSKQTRLTAYADIVVYERVRNNLTLRAIRFGGYPEMVEGLSDAIYAGAYINVQTPDEYLLILSETKRYTRQTTRDGVYAEAVLLGRDDDQNAKNAESEDSDGDDTSVQVKQDLPPRKCMIFCPAGDRDRLFEEVDRKTAVPLIPAFRDYVLSEMERRGILTQLTVLSVREKIDAWMMKCEHDDANIVSVVEDGLRWNAIAIPGEVRNPDGFAGVGSVTDYLNTFGVTVAERIRSQFQPLFDPASEPLSPEILAVNDYIRTHAGYPLYDAQLAVAESVKRQLVHGKAAFIVAECGSGKTKIGATAMAAVQALQARMSHNESRRTFNLILCPSHVARKWVREIAETLPDTYAVIVRSITELDRLYDHFTQGDKNVYAVISKEKARDGYMKRPAVRWSRLHRGFLCPDCGGVVQVPASDDGATYLVNADQFHFRKENGKNHKCPLCGSPLWTSVNPGEKSDWVKIGGYGWVYRSQADGHYDKTKNPAVIEKLDEIRGNPDGLFHAVGACRRYPLSSYIKRKYTGKLDGVIVDELHEYNNDSGQGDAMGEIFSAARKAIGMTATLINGYASGIFHLLYRTMPRAMLQDGKRYSSPSEFNNEYGVVENTYQEEGLDYASNRRASKRRTRSRQLPGVSPLVFTRFLLEKTAFLSLSDMGKNLPDYEEIPIALRMAPEVADEYRRVEKELVNILRTDRKIAQRILSTYLNLLTVYPDQPYGQPPVLHPLNGMPLVCPADTADADTIGEKEQAVLDIVRRKAENREKVLVYTSWVCTDSQRKLLKLLTENGFHAEIMSEKIRPDQREDWVQKRLASGMQVLITNPSLVETGLDLNAFTTLIFFSMGYKLFTLRQASRRSWRINQTAPKVEVYMLYYENTMQQKAMKLMASKLAVAGIIEGSFTEEGLAAMSDVQDMTSQMAKELMLGIKDNVEDIAASFKKMAIINPNRPAAPATVPAAIPEDAFACSDGQMDMAALFQQGVENQPDAAAESQPEEVTLFVPESGTGSDSGNVITLVPVQFSQADSQSDQTVQTGETAQADNSTQTDTDAAAPAAVKPTRTRKKSQNTEHSDSPAKSTDQSADQSEQNKPKRRKKNDPLDGQMDFFSLLAA